MPDTFVEKLAAQIERTKDEIRALEERVLLLRKRIVERQMASSTVRQDVELTQKNAKRAYICWEMGRLLRQNTDAGLATPEIKLLMKKYDSTVKYPTLRTYIKWMSDRKILFKRPGTQKWIIVKNWENELVNASKSRRSRSKSGFE